MVLDNEAIGLGHLQGSGIVREMIRPHNGFVTKRRILA
jgi:hypothetical protein